MKTIEEIEKLTERELMQMADDLSVKVPEGLTESLEELVGAAALTSAEPRRKPSFIPWAVAAAAAAVLALGISLSVPRRPKDTFSDPYLAYAEVQKTFDRISQKAAETAGKSVPALEKTEEFINLINR